jgi:ABC-type multidrug transport system fused ATPase/permease subunit
MRIPLPVADPGVPDTRSPLRLLVWVGRRQRATLAAGVVFGIVWMVAQALMPFAIGRAIQEGIVDRNNGALARWASVLLCLGLVQAFAGVMRHRYAVFNWLQASYRLVQIVAHHAARSGPTMRERLSTGEVVATVTNDAIRAGNAYDITARLAGAIVAYVVVAFILLSSSVVLGLIVLLGVPALVLGMGGMIRPLQARQRDQRVEVLSLIHTDAADE